MSDAISKILSPTDPDGPTGKLASWLAGFRLEHAPAVARERAKALTLDGIGCAIVGAQLPWSQTAVEIVTKTEGSGDRTIVGCGVKTSAPGAALLNGTFIQGFELDDYHPLGPLHSASLVLPALWAAAEGEQRISGRQFLEAAMAGYEVGPRVGMALHGGQMLSRGWHSGSVFGTHAAAAAVGKLLGLDAARFEDALGLAGTQSAGLMAAQYEAMCKRMHHGFSARNGMYAAILAAGGYTGIKRVFEREYGGFLSTFGEGHDPDASQITDALGERWEVERIVIKPYAAMGGIHAPLDALFDVDARRRLRAEEISRIEADVTHAVYHHGWWVPERPLTPIGAQMNIGYALAVAVLDGAALVPQFSPSRIDSDDVWALLPRIDVRHEPSFDAGGQRGRGRVRLVVTFTDGERIEVNRQMSRAIESPQTNDEVAEKYRALTHDLIEPERQASIEHMVRNLEALDDVRDLLGLLAPPVKSPFA
ncbi:MmgE/PrpD family protein [Cupriavidus necator]|uniref:MmgE/PrpD family protein n=1 Tax=Cupriavidus necator TaxID=106590 RepID=A0A1U9UVS6_CUPNE|nr:MmgE/PrpD family protein [Cupriavidus necator]AQV96798.1 MmgE/PrpD family protein [Cupriavidus necator]